VALEVFEPHIVNNKYVLRTALLARGANFLVCYHD
jgi:hypothetical protein